MTASAANPFSEAPTVLLRKASAQQTPPMTSGKVRWSRSSRTSNSRAFDLNPAAAGSEKPRTGSGYTTTPPNGLKHRLTATTRQNNTHSTAHAHSLTHCTSQPASMCLRAYLTSADARANPRRVHDWPAPRGRKHVLDALIGACVGDYGNDTCCGRGCGRCLERVYEYSTLTQDKVAQLRRLFPRPTRNGKHTHV